MSKLPRTIWRTVLVLLAGGLVIAASWMLTPPFVAARLSGAELPVVKDESPAPGSEAALRRVIGEIRQGHPDYTRMDANVADSIRQGELEQKQLEKLGPLRSVEYLGGGRAGLLPGTGFHYDRFRLTFGRETQLWLIALGENGNIARLGFQSPDPPTPRQYIDGYAAFSATVRLERAAVQLGVLLAAALFGRFVLRLRL